MFVAIQAIGRFPSFSAGAPYIVLSSTPGSVSPLARTLRKVISLPQHRLTSERLFSYGTLQLEAVQVATFGRTLAGTADTLAGFETVPLTIDDESVVALSGKAVHTMARPTGRDADVVPGTVFAVTPMEIENADKYEVPAVKRIAVVLQSGTRAWVYVDARS